MSIIFFWFAFAVIVGIAANTRARNGFGWFLLAALISPLIAGLLLIALPRGGSSSSGFRPDGMLGQTPFRYLPNGEVEAIIQGSAVRFPNLASMRAMVDPTGTLVLNEVQAAPKPTVSGDNAGWIVVAVVGAMVAFFVIVSLLASIYG